MGQHGKRGTGIIPISFAQMQTTLLPLSKHTLPYIILCERNMQDMRGDEPKPITRTKPATTSAIHPTLSEALSACFSRASTYCHPGVGMSRLATWKLVLWLKSTAVRWCIDNFESLRCVVSASVWCGYRHLLFTA